eukprot:m.122272 g.122272  ORF g.122272 m.122272 type:complete len:176 (+) comp9625_c0_seq5:2625-3152(+)
MWPFARRGRYRHLERLLLRHIAGSQLHCVSILALSQPPTRAACRGDLENAKVLLAALTPQRAFSAFGFHVLNISSKSSEYKTSDALEAVVGDCLQSVLKIGQYLRAPSTNEFDDKLSRIEVEGGEILCSQGVIEHLIKAAGLDTARSALARYSDANIVLSSEIDWPYPERLFPGS